MKFEEFYRDIDGKYYDVELLKKVCLEDYYQYKQDYYGHMYCPECKKAELAFKYNANPPYLSKKPSTNHSLDCSCRQGMADKIQADEYYANSLNTGDISKKLRQCIDLLLMTAIVIKKNDSVSSISKSKEKTDFTIESNNKRVMIRRKKITLPLRENEDYDIPILFYGCVRLKWREDIGTNKVRYIQVKSVDNRVLASIKISEKVYEYLDKEIKNINEEIYNVAFMSKMNKYKNFNNCNLINSSHIVVLPYK